MLNRSLSGAKVQTITERYEAVGGFTRGFDYLRLALALAVIVLHSFVVTYGRPANLIIWGTPARVLFGPILPMFFALSGYLVAGSLKRRPTVASFVTLRAIRLVPALAVEVLLSAVVLGALVTTLPLETYYTKWEFYRYFANIIGHIQFNLPGVFGANPYPRIVNISLWTIPFELECYLALILAYVFGVVSRPKLLLAIIAIAVVVGTVAAFAHYEPYWATNRPLGRALVVAFLVGVAINLYADRIPLSPRLALLALAMLIATMLTYQTIYLAVIPAAYLVVFLGMTHPPKIRFLLSGDYSYGLYVFAFPIQQTIVLALPWARTWYLNVLLTIVFGGCYAVFSWWCVEKPILARRKTILAIVEGGLKPIRARLAWGSAEARQPS